MKTIQKRLFQILTWVLLLPVLSYSQTQKDSSAVNPDLGADFVSRYVWRGLSLSASPNIQPYLDFGYKGFSAGMWSSYATSEPYAEVDFYISYSSKGLTVTLTDYYTEDENNLLRFNHFNWKQGKTNHALEASLGYSLQGRMPLSFKLATIFFGNDQNPDGKQFYSTYLELGYPFAIHDYQFNVSLGATPSKGLYAEDASIVQIGLSASKNLRITEHFSLPLAISILSNPDNENIFAWLTLSL
jgi:hypothetical protein